MAKRSLSSLNAAELRGKRVLVRVDFNVPLDDSGRHHRRHPHPRRPCPPSPPSPATVPR